MTKIIVPTRQVFKEFAEDVKALAEIQVDPVEPLARAVDALVSYDACDPHEGPDGAIWLQDAYEALEERFLDTEGVESKLLDELYNSETTERMTNAAVSFARLSGELYHALLPYRNVLLVSPRGFISGIMAERTLPGGDSVLKVEETVMRKEGG